MNRIKILLIEDDKIDQMAFNRLVKKENLAYEYQVVNSIESAKKTLDYESFELVISDFFLGDGNAFDILEQILATNTPVIIATGSGDEEIAVKAMKLGAYDYLIKDPERHYLKLLPVTVSNALKQKQAEEKLRWQNLRSQLLAELALKIRQSLRLEEILKAAVTEVQKFLRADRVLLFQLHSHGSGGKVVQESVVPGWPVTLGQNIVDPCFQARYMERYRQGQIRAIADLEQADLQPCYIEFLRRFGVKANLIVPIVHQEEPWGLLIAHQCTSVRQWSSFEIDLLQQLANQLGIALAQSQLVEALRESEERFRTMADSAPVLIWMSGIDKLCTYFNQSWLDFTGRTMEQERGYGWAEQGVHQSDFQHCLETYTTAFNSRRRFQMEYRLRRHDGQYRWLLSTGVPRFLADGSFAGYIGSCVDITERKEAEKVLRSINTDLEQQVEERTAALVAANTDLQRRNILQILLLQLSNQFINLKADEVDQGIDQALQTIAEFTLSDHSCLFQLSADGATLSCTHSWDSHKTASEFPKNQNLPVDYFCWSFSQLERFEPIQVSCLAKLPPEAEQFKVDLEGSSIKSFLLIPVISFGKLFGILGFYTVQAEKVWTEDEIALLLIAADIFVNALNRQHGEQLINQANAELAIRVQELNQANAELDRSNHELEHFAYIASHDLREPLRKIKSFTDLLVEDYRGQLDAQADKYLDYISDGSVRMQNLIKDLLTYSRLGRSELILEPTDLGKILEQVLSDLSVAIEENKAEIVADSLPTIQANPQQIAQLFQNLISNALKFRSDVPPQIRIEAQLQQSEWLISIRDNGIGIKPQYTERIFEIFQRLHAREKYSGTGIGLAVCRKIVERHGGRIWLESEPTQGSTFYFTVPAAG